MSAMVWSFGPDGEELRTPGYETAAMMKVPNDWALDRAGVPQMRTSRDVADAFGTFIDPRAEYHPSDPYFVNWFKGQLKRAMFHGPSPFAFEGKPIACWALGLNTVLSLGSDALAFVAKVAATHELHCVIEGADRAWAAEMIGQALQEGLLRDVQSGTTLPLNCWRDLRARLLADGEQPVVLSGSMTDSFPGIPEGWNPIHPSQYPTDKAWDLAVEQRENDWELLEPGERFAVALAPLLVEPEDGDWNPPLSAQSLRGTRFRHELDYSDLLDGDTEKVRAALAHRPEEERWI